MKRLKCWMMISGIALILTGCNLSKMFTPKVLPHPDAPILITDNFGGFVKGAVYDKNRNALIPCGWFWIGNYTGWTLHKFDWNKRIDRKKPKPTQLKCVVPELEQLFPSSEGSRQGCRGP